MTETLGEIGEELVDQAGFPWESVALILKSRIPEDAYHRWFSGVSATSAADDSVVLSVPNQIFQFWIEDNFMAPLQDSIQEVVGRPMVVRFQIGAPTLATPATHGNGQTPLPAPHPRPDSAEIEGPGGLNPRYTFDAFVVGASNEIAHAAAQAAAGAPGKTYNPLFIYGGVGLGKTHLMHAIGNAVLARKKSLKVLYVTSEAFTNEFIDALQKGSIARFRKRYRSLDVLMIDDIHFLGGKERSQEEFFHTFNSLFDGRKQIVLTSDRPASEIASLEERLVSRFDWGLSAELVAPDIETRIAILRKKLDGMRVEIGDELLQFLAQKIKTNVRRLEGALLRVAAYASLSGKSLSIHAVEHLLKDLLQEEARRMVTVDQIQKRVAEVFDLRPSDMSSKRRPHHIAFPRQIAMYLARKLTSNSLQEIGAAFGGRDHGTVLHACRTIEERAAKDDKTRQTVQYLEQQLGRT